MKNHPQPYQLFRHNTDKIEFFVDEREMVFVQTPIGLHVTTFEQDQDGEPYIYSRGTVMYLRQFAQVKNSGDIVMSYRVTAKLQKLIR